MLLDRIAKGATLRNVEIAIRHRQLVQYQLCGDSLIVSIQDARVARNRSA